MREKKYYVKVLIHPILKVQGLKCFYFIVFFLLEGLGALLKHYIYS